MMETKEKLPFLFSTPQASIEQIESIIEEEGVGDFTDEEKKTIIKSTFTFGNHHKFELAYETFKKDLKSYENEILLFALNSRTSQPIFNKLFEIGLSPKNIVNESHRKELNKIYNTYNFSLI